MRLGHLIIAILMTSSLLFLYGCSSEKSVDQSKKVVVKKPIVKSREEKNAGQPAADKEQVQAVEKKDPQKAKKAVMSDERFYIAKGDESLATIASRQDVYGNTLKWILIYRFNRDAFNQTGKDESFPEKAVPADTMLKIASTAHAGNNGSKDHWVINVLSSSEGEKIVPDAIRLIDNGFSAYITKANVKGQEYTRLRVGFYDDKSAAVAAGQTIAAILDVSDIWTTRADEAEFKEFGGYR